ncbi:MAG: hypothetical protein R3324_20635, partial [Halobacteriales archaeon]|nr:hypothetical protein [Halobacteriales archaeon]
MSDGEADVSSRRRRILNWLAGLSVVSFVLGLIVPLKDLAVVAESVGADQASNLPGQRLVFAHAHQLGPDGHQHEEGSVVTVDTLGDPPAAALVYPEDLSQQESFLISIHNLEADSIEPPTDPGLVDRGFVAYSAICTHLGCT